jgi:hypothetical protein
MLTRQKIQGDSHSHSRVNRNTQHSSHPHNRNSQTSSTLYRKCYYLFWLVLFFMVSGVTMVFFQIHFHSLVEKEEKYGITSLKNRVASYFQHDNPSIRKEPHVEQPPANENTVSKPDRPNIIPELPLQVATIPPTQQPYDKSFFQEIHFVHIPKCGGTTMTAVLRQIQCNLDPVTNADCCLNPGFCDWHAHRRCKSISGCINHFPNRKKIYKKTTPSCAVFREPISR